MSYDALESSTYGGRPAELYRFTREATVWRFTNSDEDVTVGSETYAAGWSITRNDPELSEETTRSALSIDVSRDFPIAQMYAGGAPFESVWVSVYRTHLSDTAAELRLIWQGRIKSVSWKLSKNAATIECGPTESTFGKGGLRQCFSAYCGKRLYSQRCGVPEASNTTNFTIATISESGLVVTAPEFASRADQFFRGGEFYIPELSARVLIVDHVGSSVTLKSVISGLIVGLSGRAVAGCNHIWRTAASSERVAALIASGLTLGEAALQEPPDGDCRMKFDNMDNFGGYPFVPTKNPYEVSIEG